MRRQRIGGGLLLVLLLAGLPPATGANVTRCGASAGSETWTAANVYTICSSGYTVRAGDSLTIQAGTEVRLARDADLNVDGALDVSGTPASPVLFTADATNPTPGYWGSLRLNASASNASAIRDVVIEYAATGIDLDGVSPTIEGVTVRTFLMIGLRLNGASPRVLGSSFQQDPSRSLPDLLGNGVWVDGGSAPVIEGSNLSYNGLNGAYVRLYSHLTLRNSTVFNNSQDGVRFSFQGSGDLEGNTISWNAHVGASFFGAQGTLRGNTIAKNGRTFDRAGRWGESGVYVTDAADVTLEGNLIEGNAHNGLAVFPREVSPDLHFPSTVRVWNNTFRGNDEENARDYNYPSVVINGSVADIRGNVIEDSGGDGIYVTGEVNGTRIADSVVAARTLAKTGAARGEEGAAGIYLRAASWVVLENNTFTAAGGQDAAFYGGDGGTGGLFVRSRVSGRGNTFVAGKGGGPTSLVPGSGTGYKVFAGDGGPGLELRDAEVDWEDADAGGGDGGRGSQVAVYESVGGRGGEGLRSEGSTLVWHGGSAAPGVGGQGYVKATNQWVTNVSGTTLRGDASTLALTNVTLGATSATQVQILNATSLDLLNSAPDRSSVAVEDSSTLTLRWYLHVRVLDANDVEVPDADVVVRDGLGALVGRRVTGPDGLASWLEATESVGSATTIAGRNPHNVSASKAGTSYAEATVDRTMTVTVRLAVDLSAPRVLLATPTGGGVDPSSWINVTFSRAMNRASVEAALEVLPGIAWTSSWAGNTITVRPAAPLAYQTRYVVRVLADMARNESGAQSLDGDGDGAQELSPEDDFVFDFTTRVAPDGEPPRVLAWGPQGAAVDPRAPITLTFSEPMDRASVEAALAFSPHPVGVFLWEGRTRVTYEHPAEPFAQNSNVSVTLAGTARDLAGNTLDGDGDGLDSGSPADDLPWNFTTGPLVTSPPKIEGTRPAANATAVPIDTAVEARFDQRMNQSSVEAAFSLAPSVPVSASWPVAVRTVAFQPDAYLAFDATYCASIDGTALGIANAGFDGDGDGVAEGSPEDDHAWCFTTMSPDSVPPTVLFALPANGTLGVPVDAELWAGFSDWIDKPSLAGNFTVTPPHAFTSRWIGRTLVLTPSPYFAFDTEYTVTLEPGIRDLSGNPLDGDGDGIGGDAYTWSFHTMANDTVLPRVVSTSPQDSAAAVPLEAPIALTFNDFMNRFSLLTAFSYVGGPEPGTLFSGDLAWSADNRTFTLQPFEPFLPGTTYTVTLLGSATDLSGNALDGDGDGFGGDAFIFSFMTAFPLLPAPTVLSLSPPDGATGVPWNATLSVTFNGSMDRTRTEGALVVFPPIAGLFSWSGDTMTLAPAANLTAGVTYRIRLLASATSGAASAEGVPLDGDGDGIPEGSPADDVAWSFTTFPPPDSFPPFVVEHFPAGDGVPVMTLLSARFGEPMDPATLTNPFAITVEPGGITGTLAANPDELLFTPSAPLPAGVQINVTLHAAVIADLAGNPLDGDGDGVGGDDYRWSFNTSATADTRSPVVVSWSPQGTASLDAAIAVRFNESMNATAVEAAFSYTDGSNVFTAADGGFIWSADGFSFAPAAPFVNATMYTVTLSGNATDLGGNALDGNGDGSGGDAFSWSFTASNADLLPPRVVASGPSGAEVLPSAPITIAFSEAMDEASVLDALLLTGDGLALGGYDGVSLWIGDLLVFLPGVALRYCTEYAVRVDGTARDLAGNSLDGDGDGLAEGSPADDYVWSFTTGCLPVVATWSPAGSGVPLDADVTLGFSKPMDTSIVESGLDVLGPTPYSLEWTDTDVLRINFTAGLEYGTTYTVTLGPPAADATGLPLDGNANQVPDGAVDGFSLVFRTIGLPRVVATTPGPGALDVDPAADIVLEFSEEMEPGSTLASVTVRPSSPFTAVWDDARTLRLSAGLGYGTAYTVEVSGALSADSVALDGDADGALGGLFTLAFVTDALPAVVSMTPPNGSSGVPVDGTIAILFSEAMNATATDAEIVGVAASNRWLDDRTLEVAPASPLAWNTSYTVRVNANATDLGGTTLDGDGDNRREWGDEFLGTFRTRTPPHVVSSTPAPGAAGVPRHAALVVAFSADMNATAVEALVTLTPATALLPSWSGPRILTLTPAMPLPPLTGHTLRIPGAVTDSVGVSLDGDGDGAPEGPGDDFVLNFTTEPRDDLPPRVLSTDPEDGARNVSATAVTLAFSEAMDRESVETSFQVLVRGISWSIVTQEPVAWPFAWSANDTVLAFDALSAFRGFTDESLYELRLGATAADLEGNGLDGDGDGRAEGSPADDFRIVFGTADVTAPLASIHRPGAGERVASGAAVTASGTVFDRIGVASATLYLDGAPHLVVVGEEGDWSVDLPPLTAGVHTLRLEAVDETGLRSEATVTFTVEGDFGGVLVAAGAMGLLVAVAVLILVRRRKRRQTEETQEAPALEEEQKEEEKREEG